MRWNRTFTVVGCHAEGEVGRVVTGGLPPIPGHTMFDKKRHMERHMDDIRKIILFEPRGAAAVNANIVLPSNNPKADMGFIILESTEYPPMSGSNTICTATVLLETGMVPMIEPVTTLTLEAPGGLVTLECQCRAGKVTSVRFTNVPAFALYLDTHVEVPGVGSVKLDVAYGGMMYALVDAADHGFRITPDEARDICVLGQKVKAACVEQLDVVHPENPEIRDVTIFEMRGPVKKQGKSLRARNTVVVHRALSQGNEVEVVETNRRGHATRFAQDAARRGVDVVIGFGAVEFGYQTLEKLARHVTAEVEEQL